MKKILALLILIVAAFVSSAAAQQKPKDDAAPAVKASAATPAAAPEPTVPDDAKKLLADLQAVDAGYVRAIAVLQKERDALAAEFTRTVNRLQVPGYDLTPALTYVPKKAPEPKK